jgi:uroporphyrinogen-III synthase
MKPPRVLVTRSAHQASPLAEALRARGIEPVLIPTIEIAPPASYSALDAALEALFRPGTDRVPQGFSLGSHSREEGAGVLTPAYHWLVFTSANAVEAFFQRAHQLSATSYLLLPTSCRVAAIGPATARSLESFGTKHDLIPPQAVAESLAAALTPYALQPDGSPTRFLVPCAEDTRNTLQEQLEHAKADVTTVTVYRNIIPLGSVETIQSCFKDPAQVPDAITFTSGSTVRNLIALLEAAQITLPPAILRISIGPITSQVLTDLGIPPHAEAETPSIQSLVEKLVEALDLPR